MTQGQNPCRVRWLIVLIACVAVGPIAVKAQDQLGKEFFGQHCQKCHEGTKPKGDFRIESLTDDFSDNANRRQWLAVLEQLKAGDMPPEDKPRPPEQEVQTLIDWITERAQKQKKAE